MSESPQEKISCLLISGPTAVGKTALSLHLAEALQGEIVNIDSVQVYREADIGSAKVSREAQARVPHHLIDILSPADATDVGAFRERVYEAAREIRSRGALPILVGSSGMYITALFHGLSHLPKGSAEIRQELEGRESNELWHELSLVDPESSHRLHPSDKIRIVRALEVVRLTGKPLKESYDNLDRSPLQGVILTLLRPRKELYDAIDQRSGAMVAEGLLDETRGIAERYGFNLPLLKSLGYAEAAAVLTGSLPEAELSETIALHTRRYAKRQMTFWRNEPIKRGWSVAPVAPEGQELEEVGLRTFPYSRSEVVERIRARLELSFEQNEVWFLDARAL